MVGSRFFLDYQGMQIKQLIDLTVEIK